ncbi:MAG TPA: phosphotransferase [Micromonosporaceae bacterium]|nr:phosphotransferase [Micromonosporaceae bacterium]
MPAGSLIAEGREAEVYAWGDEAVLKLYRPGFDGYVTEAAALVRLDGHGVAPRLIEVVEADGRHGLVLERLRGPDTLAMLQRRPWRLMSLARAFADAQVRVHAVVAPVDLPDLREVLAARVHAAAMPDHLRDFALRTLADLPAGDRLCHGDLHPGNAILGPDHVTVIDWTNATRGVPAADFARTMLLIEQAEPLPGTPRWQRVLIGAGRRMFARAFARSYRRASPGPLDLLASWTVVHAAARLAEGIAEEESNLVRLLDAALRGTAG